MKMFLISLFSLGLIACGQSYLYERYVAVENKDTETAIVEFCYGPGGGEDSIYELEILPGETFSETRQSQHNGSGLTIGNVPDYRVLDPIFFTAATRETYRLCMTTAIYDLVKKPIKCPKEATEVTETCD